jgi:UrcA family protein
MMMLRALTAASILALTIATAQAAPVMDVKFSDLNLSNPSDVRVLEARIHQAAKKACAPLLQTSFASLDYRIWFNDCMRATKAETTKWVEARTGQYRAFAQN